MLKQSRRGDLNPRPTIYETVALPTELRRQTKWLYQDKLRFRKVLICPNLRHYKELGNYITKNTLTKQKKVL